MSSGVQALVGRERELAQIREFLAQASGVLLLEGEAGIGKTALLQAGVDAARSSGWRRASRAPSDVLDSALKDIDAWLAADPS